MARIRTIKPEFWTDGAIIECSTNARLLFVGTWTFADDNGNLDRSAKQLKAQVFPADDIDCEPLIKELVRHRLLVEYSSNGKNYLHVQSFKKHQKVDRPGPARCPIFDESTMTPRTFDEPSTTIPPRNGMEGKGSKALSGKPDAVEVLDYLNTACKTNFQPVDANLSLILARLKEYDKDSLLRVVDVKKAEWAGTDQAQYLRPSTLFNATKCAQYVGQLGNGRPGLKVAM